MTISRNTACLEAQKGLCSGTLLLSRPRKDNVAEDRVCGSLKRADPRKSAFLETSKNGNHRECCF